MSEWCCEMTAMCHMRVGQPLDERDDTREMSAFVRMSNANMNGC